MPVPPLAIEQMGITWTGRPFITPRRTLDQEFGDLCFNVKDFGALGNSTNGLDGHDDLAAIQLAYTAAVAATTSPSTTGASVYFPPGLYHVSGPVVFQQGGGVALWAQPGGNPAGIFGSFPDYILKDELNPPGGVSLYVLKNLTINNYYSNHLDSCTYGTSGTATSSYASTSGTGNTILTVAGTITGSFGPGQLISNAGGASFTGTITGGTTLTVSAVGGTIQIGQPLFGAGVTNSPIIVGGSGTVWTISPASANVGPEDMHTGGPGTVAFDAVIVQQLSGPAGGAGNYLLSKGLTTAATGISIAAAEYGQITFTTHTAHGVTVGQCFMIFGMIPVLFNGKYIALPGTTGSTLVGGGLVTSNPGAVTMLGTCGGGGIRMDNTNNNQIERCLIGGWNAMHLAGAQGANVYNNGAYNGFGCRVTDCGFNPGTQNGTYGTVGCFCGEASFYNCNVFSWDRAMVSSSTGFCFVGGGLEDNNVAFAMGYNDQFTGGWTSHSAFIIGNHTEACGCAIDANNVGESLIAANSWTGTVGPWGTHLGITFSATTSGTTAMTGISAITHTGDTVNHACRIYNVTTADLYPGLAISGTGIPANARILTIDDATTLTFSTTMAAPGVSPVGATATGTGVTLTFTLSIGMVVGLFGSQVNLPGTCAITNVGGVSGGLYQVTLNRSTTGSGTNSYRFDPICNTGALFGTGSGLTYMSNTHSMSVATAQIDLSTSNFIQTSFIGTNGSGVGGGGGVGWKMPTTPAASGLQYLSCDCPTPTMPFASLPGQPGQTLNYAAMGEAMTFDITDCSTSTFLAVANSGGTGVAAHRRVRSTPRLTITGITRIGTTATATTLVNHGLTGTQNLTISGSDQNDPVTVGQYNGAYACDCTVAVNKFSYTVSTTPVAPVTPATGTMTYGYWQVIG